MKRVKYHKTIAEYYRCFREKDQAPLHTLLTPDFHHVSSYAEYSNREAMLRLIWPMVGRAWATDLRIFGEAPEFMVRYRLESQDRSPANMAEYIRFEANQIA
jgi:hypothetical protein